MCVCLDVYVCEWMGSVDGCRAGHELSEGNGLQREVSLLAVYFQI